MVAEFVRRGERASVRWPLRSQNQDRGNLLAAGRPPLERNRDNDRGSAIRRRRQSRLLAVLRRARHWACLRSWRLLPVRAIARPRKPPVDRTLRQAFSL